jgi:hypothetical protein
MQGPTECSSWPQQPTCDAPLLARLPPQQRHLGRHRAPELESSPRVRVTSAALCIPGNLAPPATCVNSSSVISTNPSLSPLTALILSSRSVFTIFLPSKASAAFRSSRAVPGRSGESVVHCLGNIFAKVRHAAGHGIEFVVLQFSDLGCIFCLRHDLSPSNPATIAGATLTSALRSAASEVSPEANQRRSSLVV